MVKNGVSVTAANKEELAAIQAAVVTNDEKRTDLFDFEKILPCPASLRSVPAGPEHGYLYAWYKGYKPEASLVFAPPKPTKYQLWCIRREPHSKELAAQYMSNLQQHGFATWYEWCSKHWGTKWTADCQEMVLSEDGLTANWYFDTAWAAPIPVLVALSERFPNADICLEVDMEGGWFWGHMRFKAGKLIEEAVQEGYRPGGPFAYDEETENQEAEG